MTSQFKNPLPRKNSSKPQNTNWLTEGAQSGTPGDQSQGSFSPPGQRPPRPGTGQLAPQWQPGGQPAQGRETPPPLGVPGQQAMGQPSLPGSYGLNGPNSLPQTPYMPGQRDPYAPGPGGSAFGLLSSPGPNRGPQSMPYGPSGSQMFPPTQLARPSGTLMGPGMPVGPSSFAPAPGFNSFNQVNPGASFSQAGMGMVAAPPLPGTLIPIWVLAPLAMARRVLVIEELMAPRLLIRNARRKKEKCPSGRAW